MTFRDPESSNKLSVLISRLEKHRYYRFNTYLLEAVDDMDVANRANISALKREAEGIIRYKDAELDTLCEALVQ